MKKGNFKNSSFFKILVVLFQINCVYFFIMYSNILHTEPTIIFNENFEIKK